MTTIQEILDAAPAPAPAAPPWQRAAERAADSARAEALAHGDDDATALARARAAFEMAARGVEPRALLVSEAEAAPLARWRIASDGRIVARTLAPVRPGDRLALFGADNRREERSVVAIATGPAGSYDCAVTPPPGEAERAKAEAERAAHERREAARAAIGSNTRDRGLESGLREDCDKGNGGEFDSRPDGRKVGEVCAAAAARIAADREAAARAGLLLPTPAFAIGARLNGVGISRATAAEIEHEKRPLALDALAALRDTIREERRRAEVVPWAALALGDDGHLRDARPGGFGARIEAGEAWSQIASAAGMGDGSRLLARGSDGLRTRAWKELAKKEGEVKILLRDAGGHASAWGAVGPRYPSADGDEAARIVSRALEAEGDGDARARVDYDGRGWRVEVSRHTPIASEKMASGEVVRAGLVISSHDAGGGAIRVRPAIVQNSCLNLLILDEVTGSGVTLAHRGSVERLLRDLRQGIIGARAAVAAFWDRWREASRASVADPHGTIRAIVASGRIALPGGRKGREEVARQLCEAHDRGLADATIASANGPSRASIADAFTRWAHEQGGKALAVADLDEIRSGAAALAVGRPLPVAITIAQLLAAP